MSDSFQIERRHRCSLLLDLQPILLESLRWPFEHDSVSCSFRRCELNFHLGRNPAAHVSQSLPSRIVGTRSRTNKRWYILPFHLRGLGNNGRRVIVAANDFEFSARLESLIARIFLPKVVRFVKLKLNTDQFPRSLGLKRS